MSTPYAHYQNKDSPCYQQLFPQYEEDDDDDEFFFEDLEDDIDDFEIYYLDDALDYYTDDYDSDW